MSDFLLNKYMSFLDKNVEKRLIFLSYIFSHISKTDKAKAEAKRTEWLFKTKHSYYYWWLRVIRNLDMDLKKKLIKTAFLNNFNGTYQKKRDEFKAKAGFYPPYTLILSLTAKCEDNCVGCYAKKYDNTNELEYKHWKRIIAEAKKDMGIFAFFVTGGEPFNKDELFELAADFQDCLFFVYTSASSLNDETIRKIKDIGNIFPIISINGTKAFTDSSRKEGEYNIILEKMEKLKNAQIFWGTNTVATKKNTDDISAIEYFQFLAERGAYWCLISDYYPTGDEEDSEYILDSRHKIKIHNSVVKARNLLPIITWDYYDSKEVGGCSAAGSRLLHISANGDIEPCPFVHLSVANIKDSSLKDALSSPFFKEIRKNIPYDSNFFRPCLLLDHPNLLKEYFEKYEPGITQTEFANVVSDGEYYQRLLFHADTLKVVLDREWKEKKYMGFYPDVNQWYNVSKNKYSFSATSKHRHDRI